MFDRNDSELIRFDGKISGLSAGWTFVESKAGELVYIPFEGYYESKGGRIQSPVIPLDKPCGKMAFYELAFSAKTSGHCYWWVDFFEENGSLLPDCNSAVYPGEERCYRQIFVAPPEACSIQLAFCSKDGVEVRDIALKQVSPADAAAWCDELYAQNAPLSFRPSGNALALLPKTAEALKKGYPWHVVMLGDSIVNDSYTSVFQALLKRDFPASEFEFSISVRGSTGCWYYHEPEHFRDYVMRYNPDLVMIGGISNRNTPEALENIADVIDKTVASGAEVLLMSPPASYDWRKGGTPESMPVQQWKEDYVTENGVSCLAHSTQKRLATLKNVAFWDMTCPTSDYRGASGKPFEYFNRDAVHNNDRGKQIIARTLQAYFKTAQ